jgi:hypothetical protein
MDIDDLKLKFHVHFVHNHIHQLRIFDVYEWLSMHNHIQNILPNKPTIILNSIKYIRINHTDPLIPRPSWIQNVKS